jgi:HD-GYP domain-containing protein (c-di-GMP phosphodiesterase class II)
VAKIVRHHHERFDGRGYPNGLKGEDIPIFSRILLIADTFDAMTSSRAYRKGLPYSTAFAELEEFSGSQFDPGLVMLFIDGMKKEEKNKDKTFHLRIIGKDFEKKAA